MRVPSHKIYTYTHTHSCLMALKHMGIVDNYECIRECTMAGETACFVVRVCVWVHVFGCVCAYGPTTLLMRNNSISLPLLLRKSLMLVIYILFLSGQSPGTKSLCLVDGNRLAGLLHREPQRSQPRCLCVSPASALPVAGTRLSRHWFYGARENSSTTSI